MLSGAYVHRFGYRQWDPPCPLEPPPCGLLRMPAHSAPENSVVLGVGSGGGQPHDLELQGTLTWGLGKTLTMNSNTAGDLRSTLLNGAGNNTWAGPIVHSGSGGTQLNAATGTTLTVTGGIEPIVDMVLTRRDDRYEALAASGRGHLRAHRATAASRRSRHSGRNPLADQSTDKFVGLENEREPPPPAPRRQLLPVRLRADRAALRLARRARPLRDPLGRAQLGRPGRPPRRARLASGSCRPGPRW